MTPRPSAAAPGGPLARARRARLGALALIAAALSSACAPLPPPPPAGRPAPRVEVPAAPVPDRIPRGEARANFAAVVRRVEPVAEQVCRERAARGTNCDLRIVVDDRPGLPPNAFQTRDRQGNPIVGFTVALIADARNRDELAFVLGHEAAHHIAGHIDRGNAAAQAGGAFGAVLAGAAGLGRAESQQLARAGALVGSRRFGQSAELEADALGTRIAARAGYDPLRGALFFNRLPDPGDRFLGTHPPNAARLDTVRRVAAGL